MCQSARAVFARTWASIYAMGRRVSELALGHCGWRQRTTNRATIGTMIKAAPQVNVPLPTCAPSAKIVGRRISPAAPAAGERPAALTLGHWQAQITPLVPGHNLRSILPGKAPEQTLSWKVI